MKTHVRRAFGLTLLGACVLSHGAMAAACIVSDPYAHTGDQPIAGTYSKVTGAADVAKTLDTRAFTLSALEGWFLSLRKPGALIIVR